MTTKNTGNTEAANLSDIGNIRPGQAPIRFGSRSIPVPANKILRATLGSLLIFCGLLGFLPVLGFWMIPLGLLVLSVDFHWARKLRRRLLVWLARRFPSLFARIIPGASQSSLRPGGKSE